MRPTKEMILETKQLVNETDRTIKQIIKENDLELHTIRNKEEDEKTIHMILVYGIAIIIVLILSYQAYRFFFSE
ncbi:MAG: hypothetical protein C4522_08480 [Desulfobacteraceae bacterium]|nr:MAG: hypothetical protein C4522_08480 [Desulfobacteraceae bacterium]